MRASDPSSTIRRELFRFRAGAAGFGVRGAKFSSDRSAIGQEMPRSIPLLLLFARSFQSASAALSHPPATAHSVDLFLAAASPSQHALAASSSAMPASQRLLNSPIALAMRIKVLRHPKSLFEQEATSCNRMPGRTTRRAALGRISRAGGGGGIVVFAEGFCLGLSKLSWS